MHLHEGVSESANPTDLLVRIAKLVTSVPASQTKPSNTSNNASVRIETITPATITRTAVLGDPVSTVKVVPQAITTHSIEHTTRGDSCPTIRKMKANGSSDEEKAIFFDNIASQAFLLMMDTLQRSGSADLSEGSNCIMRVLVLVIARIAHMAPESAHTFIFDPLSAMLKPSPLVPSQQSSSSNEESLLCSCVRALHWIITCYSLSSPILDALNRTDIVKSILSIQVHLLSSTFVIANGIKGLVAEIVIKILRNAIDPPAIVHILEDIIVHGLKYNYQNGKDGSSNTLTVVPKGSTDDAANTDNTNIDEMNFLSSLLQEVNTSGAELGSDFAEDLLNSLQTQGSASTTALSLAGEMNGLIQRTHVICRILTSTVSTTTSSVDSTGNEEGKQSKGDAKGRYRVNTTKAKSSLIVDRDDDEHFQNKAASITSLLFLRMLSGYLTLSSGATVDQHPSLSVYADMKSGKDHPPPHICGAALLALKDNISLDLLLHDSSEIIKLLGIFLRNRVKEIERVFDDSGNVDMTTMNAAPLDDKTRHVHDLLASSSRTTGGGPLIEEVTSDNKKKTVAREDTPTGGNVFRSLNKVPLYEADETNDDGDDDDIITTVLALLVSMLEMGSSQRGAREEALLREALLPNLIIIAGQDKNVEVAQTASDLCLIIMTRNTPPATSSASDGDGDGLIGIKASGDEQVSCFQEICNEAKREYIFDKSPAMRGLGVRNIIVALREPVEPLNASDLDEAAVILLHLLQDPESFVYLNAIHAIGRLIDHHRSKLFKTFLGYYSEGTVHHAPLAAEMMSSSVGEYSLSLRHRAVLSEAIGCALRRADQLAHQYVPLVVAACLKLCRRRTGLQSKLNEANLNTSDGANLIDVDLTAMRVSVVTVEGEGDKNKEAENEAMKSRAAASHEATVHDVCLSADEVLFRQSAFSLLAEAIGLAGLSVRQHLLEVVDVAVGALRHEIANVNNDYKNVKDVLPVRRAAVFLLRHIVAGVVKQSYSLIDVESQFKTIYRTLKLVAKDKDDVVKFHAECGLADVDTIMRNQLTLSEAQLTGEDLPKIRVIH